MNKREAEEDQRFQDSLREKLNPGWRKQLQEHYRILHIHGPVKKSCTEIINRALVLDGITPMKKRKHYG